MAVQRKEAEGVRRRSPLTETDLARIRRDFPILQRSVRGKPLVYLDNAATAQKPRQVIRRMRQFYEEENANIHRGVHYLSQVATEAYEQARVRIAGFLNARLACEVVFVRGATEGINLVAQTFGRQRVVPGDEILISAMEHHSNIVPWQMLCQEKGARLRVIPMDDSGALMMGEFERLLNPRTRLVAVTQVSNALGTVNPIDEIVAIAHDKGVPVLVDGAQAAPHMPIDVQGVGCDFFVCSGHKMCGPTGIGVLYGKAEHLDAMPPWQGGGDMILSVTFEETTYNTLPYKFEAGTPNIAGAVGLGAAVEYLQGIGMERVAAAEHELLAYGTAALLSVPGVRIIGTAPRKAGVLSFVMDCAHPHDIGQVLDDEGVAIRTGHHCAQPVMKRFGVPATARASLAFYNTRAEIDALVAGLHRVREVFA